jgi:hypothetical protein
LYPGGSQAPRVDREHDGGDQKDQLREVESHLGRLCCAEVRLE